jgi:uncharacterized protein
MKKLLFLPACLRNSKVCLNEQSENGISCSHCKDTNSCAIGRIKEFADSLKYITYIAPGGDLVEKIVEKTRPIVVIGVACRKELNQALDYLGKFDIVMDYVLLNKTGCIDTEVDEGKVKAVLSKYIVDE